MIFTLTGSVDGSNRAFTASSAFAPGSAYLVLNGRIFPRDDATYALTESSSTTITLATAPSTGDVVMLQADPDSNSGSTTWTFDTALLTDRDRVRFYCGDVDSTDQQVADATIDAILIAQPNVLLAARSVCLSRAAYFSRFADTTNGALDISGARNRAQGFEDRAKMLLADATTASALRSRPMVGGVSVSQGERMDANTDAIAPMFRRGQFGFRSNSSRRGD